MLGSSHRFGCFVASLALSGSSLALGSRAAQVEGDVQPTYNVIEFLLDDVGVDFLALYDAENEWPAGFAYPATPNIDAIAAAGVTFRNAWAHPVCSADRAASLTGRYGVISGVHPYGTGIGATVDAESLVPLGPESLALPLAHAAEGTSYVHLQVGKWHLGVGEGDAMSPVEAGGVTEYRGCLTNPTQHDGYVNGGGYDDYAQTIATSAGATQLPHQTTWMGAQELEDALALLPSDASPFVLRYWFHYGHAPWRAAVPDTELDAQATMRGNEQFPLAPHGAMTYSPSSNPADPAHPDPNVYNLVHRRMKAMIEASDRAIGEVVAALTPEQRANTILIVRSDNGTERLALNPTPSSPFNPPTEPSEPPPTYDPAHGKSKLYEQGIRVPLLVGAHPENLDPAWIDAALVGTKVDALASTVDVWATMAEATLPSWETYRTDGESLLPILLGTKTQVRTHAFSYFFSFRLTPGESCWELADPARAAVRDQAGYKLIRRLGETDELYDLSTDPLELNDLHPAASPEAMAAYADLSTELDGLIRPVEPTSFCFGDGTGTDCPCSNDNDGSRYCGRAGCANSAFASGALLFPLGESSVSSDALVLHAFGIPPGSPGVIFQADDALAEGAGSLLGHGLRCVGGNLIRLGDFIANEQGYGTSSFHVAALGFVTAGETKRYQVWYRDGEEVMDCCGSVLTPYSRAQEQQTRRDGLRREAVAFLDEA